MAVTERSADGLHDAADPAAATAEAIAGMTAARRERGSGRLRFDDVWTWACAAIAIAVVLAGLIRTAPAVGHALGWSGGATARAVQVGANLLLWAGELAVCTRLGPVLLAASEITWLLPLPGDRGRLLRPRLTRAVAAASLAGLLIGTLMAALALLLEGQPRLTVLPVALGAHVALACLAVAVGALAEARPALAPRARALGVCLAVAGGTVVVAGPSVPALTATAAFCGPWGWAGWATVAASRGDATAWAAALGVLVLGTAAVLRAAFEVAGSIPTTELLSRGGTSRQAAQGAVLLDLRALTLVMQSAARTGRRRPRLRLPLPRSRWAVGPWRDAVVLLRHPGRSAAALVVLAAGVAQLQLVTHWMRDTPHGPVGPLQATALGLFLVVPLHLAAVALAEPAYQDTDRPRRTLLLPVSPATLAVGHLVVPGLLLWAAAAVARSAALLPGAPAGTLTTYAVTLLVAGPALVATALVGAYRGAPRYDLLALSLDWFAALPFLLWRLAPALAAGFVTAPWLWHSVVGPSAGPDASATLWLAARSAVVIAWAVRRITRQSRDLHT
ncbi:hypothetical protein Snoj_30030 [Streptomyces nojiriensis]|uniref:ABC-2 type transport system permease protein n=1 Tax=Streptomyces nojiriensis TaxID=66374 RepID=A0ABQ3SLS6_9ACTN|nr:DUF6297 family protein [Streptomyces nojiriensis]QTI42667.1 hypothetical protein JYK04_00426 [Streptomyces nojiriensis]GGS15995.1 hypothetical protein GCM10010205_52210 [Streptomyces nojiriensis]GHI69085.1 hypothetical protein Snoj_30030 [Streptomyces nojiriensis]